MYTEAHSLTSAILFKPMKAVHVFVQTVDSREHSYEDYSEHKHGNHSNHVSVCNPVRNFSSVL